VTADDGSSRSARAFAFVGADGVQSPTRTRLLGGPAAVYSGTIVWRATIEMDALEGHLAVDRTSLLMGPGFHAVCYPLPHRKVVNIALFTRQKAADAAGKRPVLTSAAERSSQFGAILTAVGDGWSVWPLSTVAAPRWHEGAVGLIGDAAHAMLPFQAQGAAMAIEDAAILAPLLMTEPAAEAAFARFAAMRMKRVARVARLSARNAAIFHMEWPLTLGRDLAMKLQGRTGHLRRLDWVYGFDTAPEVETAANRP
jgi:salicylate hydroxylase